VHAWFVGGLSTDEVRDKTAVAPCQFSHKNLITVDFFWPIFLHIIFFFIDFDAIIINQLFDRVRFYWNLVSFFIAIIHQRVQLFL